MTDPPSSEHPLERIHPRSLKQLSSYIQGFVRGRLWLKVLIGMVLGVGLGLFIGPGTTAVAPKTAAVIGDWLGLPAKLFLALVQMIVVPLVFASVVRGLAASENVEQLRKLGVRTAGFFLATTVVAILIGAGLAFWIRPGALLEAETVRAALGATPPAGSAPPLEPSLEALPETLVGLLPANPLGSMVRDEMLGVVIFAITIGIALVSMAPSQSRPMLDLLGSIQEICMTVVGWAMKLAPLAVFGSMARLTSQVGWEALAGMSAYVGTVIGGLVVLLALYLLIVGLVARWSPWHFLGAVREVQLLAFSTSSSATVMPISIRTAEERLEVRPSISQFVIPLGATINMNGTALYQAVAAVFLAQVYGIELGAAALLYLVVTAVGASVGSSATPGVGIIILSMVLASVGVPAAGIALIMGVDRILDMCRTAVNVTGDLVATMVLDRWIGGRETAAEQLEREEEHEDRRERTGEDVIIEPKAG